MSFNRNIFGNNSKDEILTLVKSKEFKDIFLKHNIRNVIIFGSLTKDEFNEESDIDIAIIGDNKISSNLDLNLTLELEDFLERSIDLIDINDEDIENLIKIEALNSEMVIIKDNKYNEKFNYYDELFKENIEFWSRLDKVVLENDKNRLNKLLYDLELEYRDIQESLKFIQVYSDNELLKKELSNSLKYKYLSMFILYEDFISMLLKEYNIYKIGMTIDSAIKLLKDKNVLTDKFANYLNSARLLRNRIGHRYKQPKIEVLIEFLEENNDIKKEFLLFIKSFMS